MHPGGRGRENGYTWNKTVKRLVSVVGGDEGRKVNGENHQT